MVKQYKIILETTPHMCVSYQTVEIIDMEPTDYLEKLQNNVRVYKGRWTAGEVSHTYRIIHIAEIHAPDKIGGTDEGKKGRATGLEDQGDELPES